MSQYCTLPLTDIFGRRPNKYNTFAEALKLCPKPEVGDSLLEIACGNGSSAVRAAGAFDWSVKGLDISDSRIKEARAAAAAAGVEDKVEFIKTDFFKESVGENYSHVFSENFLSTLEIERKSEFAKRVYECMKPSGHLMIYDFCVGRGGCEDEDVQLTNIPCFVGIKLPETYKNIFEAVGFETVHIADRSMQLYSFGQYLAQSFDTEMSELGRVLAGVESVETTGKADISEEEIENKQAKIRNFFVRAGIGRSLLIFRKK